jgi:hypothetical protein
MESGFLWGEREPMVIQLIKALLQGSQETQLSARKQNNILGNKLESLVDWEAGAHRLWAGDPHHHRAGLQTLSPHYLLPAGDRRTTAADLVALSVPQFHQLTLLQTHGEIW